ncbi:binding-protein-dependent transport systems inner membrane component [Kribbella flavida DSM 17836]|uniref:Binding-protein-dependent transport systems inner membrane component n=1 Tax=Kribbella flavida (strain DSM 17836 / JCM 10339 / NBRC 14399) TaxID=479435 RepID=D2PNH2_KRIFD|nr:carbohydrate ABC transporter permease [Kribbella flavida]ADB30824.1 binding-protein-dependent transport systems inner membrane component [Kribbella flavida DSM 17836]
MATIQRSRADRTGSVLRYAVLVVGAVLFLLPFYLLVRNGLSTEQDITSPSWTFFPSSLQWSNVVDLFNDPAVPMARSLVNSLVISVVQTIGVLVISGLAGYGLARIPFRYANAVFYFIVATLLIPAAVTFVPSFVLVSTLGWVSTLRGLIVPGLFQAFATFLFRQYFLGFPRELEEAAQLDGTAYWGTFWRIVVPNSTGFIAAIGTITFIGSWNAFLWPLVIAPDRNAWTVQIALSTFLTAQTINLPQLFVAATIAILPLLVMFVFLQRWIVEGVERSGISE